LATFVNYHGDTLSIHKTTVESNAEVSSVPQWDPGSTTVLDPLEVIDPNEGHNDLRTITSSCFQSHPSSPHIPTAAKSPMGSALSSVVPETPVTNLIMPSRNDGDPFAFSSDIEFSLLMPHLWSLCPDAHFVFIVELLELGFVSKTNVKKFRKIRVVFMNTFHSYVASNSSSVPTSPLGFPKNLDNEIPSLLTWLPTLDSTAHLFSVVLTSQNGRAEATTATHERCRRYKSRGVP
jgi:hypothetical protein